MPTNPFSPRAVETVQRLQRGLYFRRLRKQHGLTLQEVADQLGLSKSKLSLVETGKQDLQPEALEKLDRILRPDLSEQQRKKLAEERRIEAEQAQLQALAQSLGLKGNLSTLSLPFLPRQRTPEEQRYLSEVSQLQSKRSKRLIREYGSIENYERFKNELQRARNEAAAWKSQSAAQAKQIKALSRQIEAKDMLAKGDQAEIALLNKLLKDSRIDLRKLKMRLKRTESRAWARRLRSRREAEA